MVPISYQPFVCRSLSSPKRRKALANTSTDWQKKRSLVFLDVFDWTSHRKGVMERCSTCGNAYQLLIFSCLQSSTTLLGCNASSPRFSGTLKAALREKVFGSPDSWNTSSTGCWPTAQPLVGQGPLSWNCWSGSWKRGWGRALGRNSWEMIAFDPRGK